MSTSPTRAVHTWPKSIEIQAGRVKALRASAVNGIYRLNDSYSRPFRKNVHDTLRTSPSYPYARVITPPQRETQKQKQKQKRDAQKPNPDAQKQKRDTQKPNPDAQEQTCDAQNTNIEHIVPRKLLSTANILRYKHLATDLHNIIRSCTVANNARGHNRLMHVPPGAETIVVTKDRKVYKKKQKNQNNVVSVLWYAHGVKRTSADAGVPYTEIRNSVVTRGIVCERDICEECKTCGWEPQDAWKGALARASLLIILRYIHVEDTSSFNEYTWWYMQSLPTLIEWDNTFAVSAKEFRREALLLLNTKSFNFFTFFRKVYGYSLGELLFQPQVDVPEQKTNEFEYAVQHYLTYKPVHKSIRTLFANKHNTKTRVRSRGKRTATQKRKPAPTSMVEEKKEEVKRKEVQTENKRLPVQGSPSKKRRVIRKIRTYRKPPSKIKATTHRDTPHSLTPASADSFLRSLLRR